MKAKFYILATAVAATAMFTSCDKSESAGSARTLITVDNSQPETAADSISYLKGKLQGSQMAGQLADFEESMGRKFDVAQFEEGLRTVLSCDSADMSYLIGLQVGMQTLNEMMMLNEVGAGSNKGMFAAQIINALNGNAASAEEIATLTQTYQSLWAPIQDKVMEFQRAKFIEAQKKRAEKIVAKQDTVAKQDSVAKAE